MSHVVFEVDCKNVVDTIHDHWQDRSEAGLTISDCKTILSQFPHFRIELIRRQANAAAYTLARVAITNDSPYIYHYVLHCIVDIINNKII